MKNLHIDDLSVSEELDSSTMANIQGGRPNLHHLFPSQADLIPGVATPIETTPWGGFVLPEDPKDPTVGGPSI